RDESLRWSGIVALAVAVAYLFIQWPLESWTDTSPGVGDFFLQPLIWLAVAAVAFYGWIRLEGRPGFSGRLIIIAVLAGALHLLVVILSGLIGSFADSNVTEGFFGGVKAVWFIATLLAGVELARAYLYAVWKTIDRQFAFIATTVGFAVVALSGADLTPFDDLDTFSRVAGSQWAPALAVSILATALVRVGGAGPSAVYRFVVLGFAWLSPSLPDLDWRVMGAVGVLAPYLAWLFIVNVYGRDPAGAKALTSVGFPRKKSLWVFETILGIAGALAIILAILGTGVLGYRTVVIEDDTMVPAYERGDMAMIQDDPDVTQLEPDDVIRFRRGGVAVLRRIVAVEEQPDGLVFTIKADASDRLDPPVTADRVDGKVSFHISDVGHASLWLRGDPDPPFGRSRTYFESLDLGTPVAAARTLVDAFRWNDFMTVWLALDPDAQATLEQDLDLAGYGRLIGVAEDTGAIEAELRDAWDADGRTIDPWYRFDQVMVSADRYDVFLIDLSGTVTFGDADILGTTAEVPAEVAGIDGEVVFRLTGSAAGDWRVHQVVVPGGDESRVPWSVPSGG
ncbi:MAG TPA: hypothetical protein VLD62_07265, partial [Acidimicrobiia bacterium]|nr:hypothetical protein [Acidimicrobiia bacterium]